jgi:hypothetical protein
MLGLTNSLIFMHVHEHSLALVYILVLVDPSYAAIFSCLAID